MESFPAPVQRYLRKGERLGRASQQHVPASAGGGVCAAFLRVYPNVDGEDHAERIWAILKRPDTLNNLSRNAKTYGNGAMKVEPRALENLPIPDHGIAQVGDVLEGTARAGAFPSRRRRRSRWR